MRLYSIYKIRRDGHPWLRRKKSNIEILVSFGWCWCWCWHWSAELDWDRNQRQLTFWLWFRELWSAGRVWREDVWSGNVRVMVEFKSQELFQISLIFFRLIVSLMQFVGGQSRSSVWLQKQIFTIRISFLALLLENKQFAVVILMSFIWHRDN
jgi:hypothetical protein